MRSILLTLFACLAIQPVAALEPIPDKLVVLTFDDGRGLVAALPG